MYCQNCGKQIADETRFCPHCGQQKTPVQSQQTEPQSNVQQPYQQPYQQQPARKAKKKGCLIGVIVAAALILVLVIALIAGGGSCSITTAHLAEAAMASEVDPETRQAVRKTSQFRPDTSVIYATALLKNAPEGTLVTAEWYYVTEKIDIAAVDIEATETNQYISFSLSRPTNGFPAGDYEVTLYIDGEEEVKLTFTVE